MRNRLSTVFFLIMTTFWHKKGVQSILQFISFSLSLSSSWFHSMYVRTCFFPAHRQTDIWKLCRGHKVFVFNYCLNIKGKLLWKMDFFFNIHETWNVINVKPWNKYVHFQKVILLSHYLSWFVLGKWPYYLYKISMKRSTTLCQRKYTTFIDHCQQNVNF